MAIVAAVILTACQSSVSPRPGGSGAPGPTGAPVAPSGSGDLGEATALPSGAPSGVDIAASRYRPATGRAGGDLIVGDIVEANAFQPYLLAKPSDRRVAAAAWSSLVTLAPDGRYLPILAASVPTTVNGAVQVPGRDGDAMTVTWQLRPDLRWSDGQPLTCDDVRYTWQWANDPDNIGVDRTGFEDLTDVECRSTTEMVWHFARPYAAYLDLLPTPLPRHALEPIAMTDQVKGSGFRPADLPALPVSGPFRFSAVSPGDQLKLVRNPSWANPFGGRPAHLASVTWRWYATPTDLIAAFRAGEVDVAVGIGPADVRGADGLAASTETTPSLDYETVLLNWAGGGDTGATPAKPPGAPTGCAVGRLVWARGTGCPAADEAIRRAVDRAIDRGAIADGVYGGTATVIDSAIVPDAWFSPSVGVGHGADPAAARAILDAAGWKPGPDGIRARDGLVARLEICSADDAAHQATAVRIATDLRAVGIDAVTDPVPADQLEADPPTAGEPAPCTLSAGAFDAAQVTRTSATDPLGLFFAWHSSQIPPNGTNLGSVNDAEIDAALASIASSADPVQIREAVAAAAEVAGTRVAEVPLVRHADVALVDAALGNVEPNPLEPAITWNAGDWYRAK